jgi:hypothetical protein
MEPLMLGGAVLLAVLGLAGVAGDASDDSEDDEDPAGIDELDTDIDTVDDLWRD